MTHWLCCVQHSSRQMMIKVTNVILSCTIHIHVHMRSSPGKEGTENPVKITLRHIYPSFKLYFKYIQFVDALAAWECVTL
uniref:Uncharacterized protein n=1 Tax=Glossina palpalis gambiensis TaxID=67801 RepID=A0A1B0BRT0_9MUSC